MSHSKLRAIRKKKEEEEAKGKESFLSSPFLSFQRKGPRIEPHEGRFKIWRGVRYDNETWTVFFYSINLGAYHLASMGKGKFENVA